MMHARRDAAFYAHIGNKSRFYGPRRRVVAAQELHLLLVGAHGRRDLLAEGGHGSLVSRCAAVQKRVARCRSQVLRGAATASAWAVCSCCLRLCHAYEALCRTRASSVVAFSSLAQIAALPSELLSGCCSDERALVEQKEQLQEAKR
jgi:hypothetical protein